MAVEQQPARRVPALTEWEYAPAPGGARHRPAPGSLRALRRRQVRRAEVGRVVRDDLAGDRGAARRGRPGRARRTSTAAVEAARAAFEDGWSSLAPVRAREVPLPDRADPPGALARARGARDPRRRQADPREPRRRPAARGRALLLLRGLGRQARVRVPEPEAEAARRRRPDHPVELPAADARVEDRARARGREHRRPEAGRDDAADGALLRRRLPPGGAAAGRRQHRHRRRPRPAPRSSSTRTSTRSRSPARPRSARRSSASSPAPARS